MTTIEKIRAEIEKRKEEASIGLSEYDAGHENGICETCNDLLSFLSTIEESEKPMNQEGLDQEIIKCWQEWVSPSNKQSVEGVLPLSEFAFYARHFAQWGAEHLKK